MRLGDFVLSVMEDAAKMRAAGVSAEDLRRGIHASVIDFARDRGLIFDEKDLPVWFLKTCGRCLDSGWEPTTRLVRGEVVDAYRRCACKGQNAPPSDDRHVAAKVSSGWKQVGRR